MPRIEKVTTTYAIVTELVEMRGIEPLSEKKSARVSPGAVRLQHSLCARPANKPTHW